MKFYIKRTVLVYFYLLTIQVACFPGMLNENDDIAKNLQCWISNNVNELLQIEKLNSEEFGLFRTQIGHAIIFEDFNQYSLGQNVMTFINKKVSLKYIMNLRFQQSVNIDHSLQEGLNFVYIKTKLNLQQDGIILHIFNIYQQGQLKQIIQETNNGIVYSLQFHEQQDYYVQIIFATLIQNKFNANYADIVPFIKLLQKDYQVCSILECKKDIYLPQIINRTKINQLEPKYIKQAYFRTSQSIQYYDMINQIYFGNINVEDDKILNHVEFTVDCIQLMQNQQDRDGIIVEQNQYFCINNLVYHFKIKKIQNQKHSQNYFLLFQVNHDINAQELLLQLFNLLDNLKCFQGDHITHNLQKLKEKNSSFIQQFQTSEKLQEDENIELKEEMKTEDLKMEVEEIIFIQKEEILSPQNKQSALLTEQDSHSETIDFFEMPQFYGQISLVQQNIQEQLSEDDIFSQPLQVEEALHQQRLNQIEEQEKKTQEVQEAITFEQNQQQQQKQQTEDIVFDEYNQEQLERNKQTSSPELKNIENQVENQREKQNNLSQESHHQHHHHHQEQYGETNGYESYELHRNHHTHNHHHHHQNHHHHHEQEYSENNYSNYEYDNPIDAEYLKYQHEHHHHRKHHHKYYQQEDQNILSNQDRYNLRGSQQQNKYEEQREEPEVVDKIVIEFNFQQREVLKDNEQAKQPKEQSNTQKTQKMENQQYNQKNELKNSDSDKSKSDEDQQTQASKNSSNQQREQVEDVSSQDKNKQKGKQKVQDKQKVEEKQKSEEIENDRNGGSEQNKNDEEIEEDEAQKNQEQQKNIKNKQKLQTQKQKEEQKEEEQDEDKEKENSDNKHIEQENQELEEEDKPSNKNKNKDQNNKNKNKNKDQEDNENENEENKQEDQENQETNQDEVEKQDDQEETKDKTKQKGKEKSDKVKDKAKIKKKEDCKKNKKQKEEAEEVEKDAQQDEDIQQENEQQEEKNEDIEVEEQAEEIYDDYGRYKPNDPFYEHRHSKRGRVPFNYPTRDPYQDMFEDEMFWRYNMMKRQQARFPFNGYPYRHRGRSIDHSPFPHVNSYYKQHPYQKQTYNAKPLFGRDFYPEAGYGMSRVIDAYKGRYTDPEQVLREISMRHQQEKMWRDSLRQYRETVGYSRGPSEYFDDYVPWQNEVPQGSRETFQTQDQFSPFQFNKEIQEETYDYLNDPQYKFRQGKRELVKNFSKPNNKVNYDSYEPRDCFVIYDQCNFQGNRLDLCGEYPDIPQYLNNFKVFSFIVPDNLKIKLFQSTQFQDDLQDVEGTQECLEIPYELVPAQ